MGNLNAENKMTNQGMFDDNFKTNGTTRQEGEQQVGMDKIPRVKKPAITLPNGGIYTGEWVGNARDGFGVQQWPDGSRYEGYYKQDRATGYGKLYHADGDTYEGDWLND